MKTKSPPPEAFDGRTSEMRTSPWLASEDLLGLGDVPAKIAGVYRHREVEFEAGRSEPVVYTVAFAGKSKQLVLNATNRKALVRKFGANVKEWIGKTVVLHVDDNVRLMGKTVCGIRIK